MNSREYLKELVRESVMEALSESVNGADEALNESVERDIIVTEGAKLTPQGRRVLDDIEQILVENTEHLTAGQTLHRYLFGGSSAISQDRVNKIVSGVDKIFDVCHRTDLFSKGPKKDKVSYLGYLAVKGKFVYQFQLKFSVGSNKVVSASFTEKQIEAANFVIPTDAIKMAIKGCSSDYILEISNTTIKSYSVGRGFYQPNILNDKLLRAIANKYEVKCRFDENAGGVVFYNMERLTYSGTGSNGNLI
jgi:hypothetical protein